MTKRPYIDQITTKQQEDSTESSHHALKQRTKYKYSVCAWTYSKTRTSRGLHAIITMEGVMRSNEEDSSNVMYYGYRVTSLMCIIVKTVLLMQMTLPLRVSRVELLIFVA